MTNQQTAPVEALKGPVLGFCSVTLGYEKRVVLSAIELDVPWGSFVSITGVSGAGKSTFLRAAAGLLLPQQGSIRRSTHRVAWVPQAETLGALHPVSALEVAAGAGANRERASAALDSLGLRGERQSRFSQLSGGQRQRVLVARALALDADLVVFDEPTSALDDESSGLVRAAAARRCDEGATILYATHQPDEVQQLETMGLVVEAGRVSVREDRR